MFFTKSLARFEEIELSGEGPIFLRPGEHCYEGPEFLILVLELKEAQPLNLAQASQMLHMVRNIRHNLSDEYKAASFDDARDLDALRFHIELAPAEIGLDERPVEIKTPDEAAIYKRLYKLIVGDLGRANRRLANLGTEIAAQITSAFENLPVQSDGNAN